jgi:hypothetical protein
MKTFIRISNLPILPVKSDGRSCPACQSTYIDRVKRRLTDRILSLFVPIRRYCCSECGWVGSVELIRK